MSFPVTIKRTQGKGRGTNWRLRFRTIICWEKMVYIPTMSQIELAWTSFDTPARLVKINNTDINRFHPTQKPVKLYEWLLRTMQSLRIRL